jgi:hypothetical protein
MDNFSNERLSRAYDALYDIIRRRCRYYLESDWAILNRSVKILAYVDNTAIEGVPIDWFVRGVLPEYHVPEMFKNDTWGVIKRLNVLSVPEYIMDKMPDFTVEVCTSTVRYGRLISVYAKFKTEVFTVTYSTRLNITIIDRSPKKSYSNGSKKYKQKYRSRSGKGYSRGNITPLNEYSRENSRGWKRQRVGTPDYEVNNTPIIEYIDDPPVVNHPVTEQRAITNTPALTPCDNSVVPFTGSVISPDPPAVQVPWDMNGMISWQQFFSMMRPSS